MRRRQRIAALGLAVAVAAGLSGAAAVEAASVAGASPAGKSGTSTSKPEPGRPDKPREAGRPDRSDKAGLDIAALARRFQVPQAELEQALGDAKRTLARLIEGGQEPTWLDPAVVAVVARDLGVSPARATALLKQLPFVTESESVGGSKGVDGSKGAIPPDAAAELAKILHVSEARATAALQRLSGLQARSDQVLRTDPGFAAVARSLGVSPQVFENALRTVKQHLAATSGESGTK